MLSTLALAPAPQPQQIRKTRQCSVEDFENVFSHLVCVANHVIACPTPHPHHVIGVFVTTENVKTELTVFHVVVEQRH